MARMVVHAAGGLSPLPRRLSIGLLECPHNMVGFPYRGGLKREERKEEAILPFAT